MEPEHPKLFALEFGIYVYTLASTNINQSAPNLVKICDNRISDGFGYECNRTITELFALEFSKIAESDCLYPSIYKM